MHHPFIYYYRKNAFCQGAAGAKIGGSMEVDRQRTQPVFYFRFSHSFLLFCLLPDAFCLLPTAIDLLPLRPFPCLCGELNYYGKK
jgi:hypothetical protein